MNRKTIYICNVVLKFQKTRILLNINKSLLIALHWQQLHQSFYYFPLLALTCCNIVATFEEGIHYRRYAATKLLYSPFAAHYRAVSFVIDSFLNESMSMHACMRTQTMQLCIKREQEHACMGTQTSYALPRINFRF